MTKPRRGGTLVESAVVAAAFLLLLAGIMECGRLGLACNSVSFAAQCAARYASVNGSASGHPVTGPQIEAVAKGRAAGLDSSQITAVTKWFSNNSPGSTVQVIVSYKFATVLAPLSATTLTMQTTAQAVISQ